MPINHLSICDDGFHKHSSTTCYGRRNFLANSMMKISMISIMKYMLLHSGNSSKIFKNSERFSNSVLQLLTSYS